MSWQHDLEWQRKLLEKLSNTYLNQKIVDLSIVPVRNCTECSIQDESCWKCGGIEVPAVHIVFENKASITARFDKHQPPEKDPWQTR